MTRGLARARYRLAAADHYRDADNFAQLDETKWAEPTPVFQALQHRRRHLIGHAGGGETKASPARGPER